LITNYVASAFNNKILNYNLTHTTNYGTDIRAYELKLKHTFTISRESIDIQPSLIVELRSDGFSGYGATSNHYKTTVPVMIDDLNKIRSIIESTTDVTPEVLGKNTSLI
jgi:hypothetical protein